MLGTPPVRCPGELRSPGVQLDIAELVETEQVESPITGDKPGSLRSSAASTNSLTRAAQVTYLTALPCSQAAMPRPMRRWLLRFRFTESSERRVYP
jgi:hypothetical protein